MIIDMVVWGSCTVASPPSPHPPTPQKKTHTYKLAPPPLTLLDPFLSFYIPSDFANPVRWDEKLICSATRETREGWLLLTVENEAMETYGEHMKEVCSFGSS